jgi:DNA primase
VEILALARQRENLTTGGLIEHFSGREEEPALKKLALQDLLTDPEKWESDFVGAQKRLDLETLRQREVDLNAKLDAQGLLALTPEERDEIRRMQPAIRALEAELRSLADND